MMKPHHYIEYFFFLFFSSLIRLFSLKTARRFGELMGLFFYSIIRYRRFITIDNLTKAFPEKSKTEIKIIAKNCYRGLGITFYEFMWSPRFTPEQLKHIAKFGNHEVLEKAHKKGKGLIMLTGHFGNWEMIAQSFPLTFGIVTHSVVKTQSNKAVDKAVNKLRTYFGCKVISMDTSVREMLRVLANNEALGIVGDQSAPEQSVRVPFFNREVPVHMGAAVLSLRTSAPIIAGFGIRNPDGTYITNLIEIPQEDINGYSEENVKELTRRHTALIEDHIRKNPEMWMWMHRRWKHSSN